MKPAKLDIALTDVGMRLEADGKQMLSLGNSLYLYHAGAWALANPENAYVNRLFTSSCGVAGFSYASNPKAFWQHVAWTIEQVPVSKFDESGWIAARNGTIDPFTNELHEHDAEHYITRRVDIDFDPAAKCPEWMKMLRRMVEDKSPEDQAQYLNFLQQWFGMAVVGFGVHNIRPLRKMLLLYGVPGTAKTSIAEVLKGMFQEQEVASPDMKALSSEFGGSTLVGATALITDEGISGKQIVEANLLKKIITGESMTANIKHRPHVTFRFMGPVCMTINDLPKVEEQTGALFERIVLLTFTRVFTPTDQRKHLNGMSAIEYLRSINELPGVLNWALAGAREAIENGRLPDVADAKEEAEQWRVDNDPVEQFFREFVTRDDRVSTSRGAIGLAIQGFSHLEYNKIMSPREATAKFTRRVRGWGKHSRQSYTGVRVSDEGLGWLKKWREADKVPNGSEVWANKTNV